MSRQVFWTILGGGRKALGKESTSTKQCSAKELEAELISRYCQASEVDHFDREAFWDAIDRERANKIAHTPLYETCEWSKIEDALQVVLHHMPNIHERSFDLAEKACLGYFSHRKYLAERPRYKQIKHELLDIYSAGNELVVALENMSKETGNVIYEKLCCETEDLASELGLEDHLNIAKDIPDIDDVLNAVRLLMGLVKDPDDWLDVPRVAREAHRGAFIKAMATAYGRSTGKIPLDNTRKDHDHPGHYSEFFVLIKESLDALGHKHQSLKALEVSIVRALSGRKPRIDAWPEKQ